MEPVDYFSNHRNKLRFPWRLYHAPIVQALGEAVAAAPGTEALNVGSGPFFELPLLPATSHRWTVCDIDPRAVELARSLHPDRVTRADVTSEDGKLPYPDGSFSLVATMDVIEHVERPLEFARELSRVLHPGGHLFLTTPNYGSVSLRWIEKTALEAIARAQGFSRKHLHPSQLDRGQLNGILESAGFREVNVRRIAFGWVLAAGARQASVS